VAGVSVNDVVSDWGTANTGIRDFSPSEQAVMASRSQDTFMADYPALFYNEALILAATAPLVTDNINLGVDNIVLGVNNVVLTY
jgi:hypothetical protein